VEKADHDHLLAATRAWCPTTGRRSCRPDLADHQWSRRGSAERCVAGPRRSLRPGGRLALVEAMGKARLLLSLKAPKPCGKLLSAEGVRGLVTPPKRVGGQRGGREEYMDTQRCGWRGHRAHQGRRRLNPAQDIIKAYGMAGIRASTAVGPARWVASARVDKAHRLGVGQARQTVFFARWPRWGISRTCGRQRRERAGARLAEQTHLLRSGARRASVQRSSCWVRGQE